MQARGLLLLAKELLANLKHRPATRDYGVSQPPEPEPGYRGLHRVDPSKCIGCSLCALECPSQAIEMVTVGVDPRGKPRRIPVIHYSRCIFCYHCVDICPRKAYQTSTTPPPPTTEPETLIGEPPRENQQ